MVGVTSASVVSGRGALPDDGQRWAHVRRIQNEHPPIDLGTVDFTVRRPDLVRDRYGGTLDYMARVELEVERNILELGTILPNAPELDRFFYRDVWHPQETRHGLILDAVLATIGHRPAVPDLDSLSVKIRTVGALAHLNWFQDVVRMVYYLTGAITERTAVLAYHRLQDGLKEMGEHALADTAITPIRRQEPGHYAYYQASCRVLWAQLAGYQRWLVRRLRAISFAPVGANTPEQTADIGAMIQTLEFGDPAAGNGFTEQISRIETELLWAHRQGLRVPPYVVRSFAEAIELARTRRPNI